MESTPWIGFQIIQAIGSIGTALAFGVLIWSIIVALRTANAAQEATSLATGESEISTRPWVGVIDIS